MKKSFLSKVLALFFFCSLMIPVTVTMTSCSKPKYNKSRNGGKRVGSSGRVGNRKSQNRHVWGK